MAVELKVPEVGESVTDVQIGQWLKTVGDSVKKDETLVIIETDKVSVELPAPADGTLTDILVPSGGAARVRDVIGRMDVGDRPATDALPPAQRVETRTLPQRPETSEATPLASAREEAQGPDRKPSAEETHGDAPSKRADGPERPAPTHVMPSARRLLHERGLRADDVEPTGPGSRLLKEDVLSHPRASGGSRAPEGGAEATESPPSSPSPEGRKEGAIPMTPMRRRIAERLVAAQQGAALLTTFNECDMSEVMALRKRFQEAFSQRHGVKLGFMAFFIKATVDALRAIPEVNAEIRGTDIVYKNYQDIGVAIGGGRGLVVPILRNAERMTLPEIERAIADFAARAASNQLKLSELQGGTFTISNGGVYGSLLSTPIVNPPQSGILGLHAIQERPVVREGVIVARPMMYVALTYDHRLVDGREAVTFLKHIKESIEAPARMLLDL